jgi:branched-subunit amino acid ABC-type transport system permease component
MSWDYVFVQVANGAVIGIIYALIAVGVTLIFSILKIVNFAHGDLYMLGGYCAYYTITLLGVPPLPAMFVSMAALFSLAIVLERLLLTPLYDDATERKDEYGLIVTFGLAFFLRNIAIIAFGPFPLKPPSFIPGVQRFGGLVVTNDRLFAGGVGIVLILPCFTSCTGRSGDRRSTRSASRATRRRLSASTRGASTPLRSASARHSPPPPAPSSRRSSRWLPTWACCRTSTLS